MTPADSSSDPDRIQWRDVDSIRPSKLNDEIYRRTVHDNPEFQRLVASVEVHGILEPLIVDQHGNLISGHRRLAAAKQAGLKSVPCIVRHVDKQDDHVQLLREANRQRVKSFDEQLREAVVDANPDAAIAELTEHRQRMAQTRCKVHKIELGDGRRRAEISSAKRPFLNAIQAVLRDLSAFWPVSARQVHYRLLNSPPLTHASKPGSTYRNDQRSYKSFIELATRARLTGDIDSAALADETRPIELWDVQPNVAGYLDDLLCDLFLNYRRDLLISQPNHLEMMIEKNSVLPVVAPVAQEFCLPLTSGRGYCSLPPREAIADRFVNSGKEKLVLLVVSDLDPDGECIASSLARSLRDDFLVRNVVPIKVALTAAQVRRYGLPPGMIAKAGASTRDAFVSRHGQHVYELESLAPTDLQQLTREAIGAVLDLRAFEHEIAEEKRDAAELMARRRIVLRALGK